MFHITNLNIKKWRSKGLVLDELGVCINATWRAGVAYYYNRASSSCAERDLHSDFVSLTYAYFSSNSIYIPTHFPNSF